MIRSLRQQQILNLLETRGNAAITYLAEQFDVSDETIRRDLKVLSEEGNVEKFHGGVRLAQLRSEPPFERRLREATAAKTSIARKAAAHIHEGATILMDNSTTACFLARELVHREPLTILTISLEIANIFSQSNSHHRVILPCGELRNADRTITGAGTIEFLSRFSPGYFVTSMVAASAKGCDDFDLFEAEFKRAMIPRADEVMVLLDTTKFGKSGLIQVCDWSEVDVLVTDAEPPHMRDHLEHLHLVLSTETDGDADE